MKKLLAFPLWFVFFLLSTISKPLFFLLRIACIIVHVLSIGSIYLAVTTDAEPMLVKYILTAVISIILFLTSPDIRDWIIDKRYTLKDAALFPVKTKPNQRFKVDYTYWENN